MSEFGSKIWKSQGDYLAAIVESFREGVEEGYEGPNYGLAHSLGKGVESAKSGMGSRAKDIIEYDFWRSPDEKFIESMDEGYENPGIHPYLSMISSVEGADGEQNELVNSRLFHMGRGLQVAIKGLDYGEAEKRFSDWNRWDEKGYSVVQQARDSGGEVTDVVDSDFMDRVLLESEKEKIRDKLE